MQKVPRGDGESIWKVSNATVSLIPESSTKPHGYPEYVEELRDRLPDNSFLGYELFKWVLSGSGRIPHIRRHIHIGTDCSSALRRPGQAGTPPDLPVSDHALCAMGSRDCHEYHGRLTGQGTDRCNNRKTVACTNPDYHLGLFCRNQSLVLNLHRLPQEEKPRVDDCPAPSRQQCTEVNSFHCSRTDLFE